MRVTKYVITSPESEILPSDIAMHIYGSKRDVHVKETCFGVIINGEEKEIEDLVREIRAMDPNGIFIKDRGFPPGDPRRCRGHRGGGPRPGFFMLECESKMLPMISRALEAESRNEPIPEAVPEKMPLSMERLVEIIKDEFA
ncbi:MAG: methanogenesis marker 6 protein [Methanothrix sp.]|uniref:methanogenesis marker 6 protein n=1 Tax=Methanothrix sp. TaxID=90426 RepID=UPI003164DC79|nr:methanogenesis marker 6 protein [Methanothrix sp.]